MPSLPGIALRPARPRGALPPWLALALAALLGLAPATARVAADEPPAAAVSPTAGDELIVQAREALRRGDRAALAATLEAVTQAHHPLAMWVDYWELSNRLADASQGELDAFYARWPGTYVEDRLRNDWLLELGRRRDWADFRVEFPRFVLDDDPQATCYWLITRHLDGKDVHAAATAAWTAMRDPADGCALLGSTLAEAHVFTRDDIWRQIRLAAEFNRQPAALAAAGLIGKATGRAVASLWADPARFLRQRPHLVGSIGHELALLALMRLATDDPEAAADLIVDRWHERMPLATTATAWAQLGKQAALKQLPQAAGYSRLAWKLWDAANRPNTAPPWGDDLLAWQVRAALRQPDSDRLRWPLALRAIAAMTPARQREGAWVYWKARATLALARPGAAGDAARADAREALASIAARLSFYGLLANEDLGSSPRLPGPPLALSAAERDAPRSRPGLVRALQLIGLGLRSEGVREWNFTLRELPERELLAAAQWACERELWDRCINASDRTRFEVDIAQRFPLPFRDQVVSQARQAGLDPAVLYGLIRQESRFVVEAQSQAGAGGLMQVMPATARWTARKIGIPFRPEMLADRDLNLQLGIAYFKRVLDNFDGSLPLATAAYNAGPRRASRWRAGGAAVEPAVWAENIPFNETRSYVKNVLANSVIYAMLLGPSTITLKDRLGPFIGPPGPGTAADRDLP